MTSFMSYTLYQIPYYDDEMKGEMDRAFGT